MDFHISGLDREDFDELFGQDDRTLAAQGIQRMTVDAHPGFPCRISLQDAQVGDTVLLLNYEHLPVNTPYRSRHAIFVSESAATARLAVNEIPESLVRRTLSVRAFDNRGQMLDAEVVEGDTLPDAIKRLFSNEACKYLHVHNAARGCYAARVDRVGSGY